MKKEAEKFADSNLFEGMTSLRAIMESTMQGENDRKIEIVYFAEEKREKKARELAFLQNKQDAFGYQLQFLPLAKLHEMATGNTHGGILARCSGRTFPTATAAFHPQNPFLVMIDGVEDPYNFGYALRSLYAAGANGILLSPRNWMGAAGVVCRASAGASERFAMYNCDPDPVVTLQAAKNAGYRIICADLTHSVSVYDANLSFPLLLVVGGEKRGICAPALQCADCIVRLDYGREFSAALSTASAATILGFEIFRRNRGNV